MNVTEFQVHFKSLIFQTFNSTHVSSSEVYIIYEKNYKCERVSPVLKQKYVNKIKIR